MRRRFGQFILDIARNVREEMEQKYNYDLAGHCIEASEEIANQLISRLHLDAVTREGWCRFDDESYGSDRPWDPHTWVEILSLSLYVDVTADQFNYGMYRENEFPEVIVQKGLPFGMQYDEPSWDEYEEEIEDDFSVKVSTGSARSEKGRTELPLQTSDFARSSIQLHTKPQPIPAFRGSG